LQELDIDPDSVLGAGKDGSVETYIVCPAVVYGGAAIASKTIGVGYNLVTGNAKPLGYVPYVGDGSAVLATTHIIEVISFLLKIIERAAEGPADGSVYSRWYNLQTNRVAWKDLATELAKVMFTKGIFQSNEPKSVPIDEAGEGEVKHLVGSNMLMEGPRAAQMGHKPTQRSILEQIHEDLKDATL
jgi:nucleoside-diphosphate-sugar epimerase